MNTYYKHELEEFHDELLNDVYEPVKIGSLTYNPARVLKEVDPIAYRCSFNDWLDAEGYEETTDNEGRFCWIDTNEEE